MPNLEQEKRDRELAERPRTTGPTERFGVWWNLRRDGHHVAGHTLWIALVLGVGFGFSALHHREHPLPGEVRSRFAVVALVCGAVAALALLYLAVSHVKLRSWRARLPFPVELAGWSSLVDQPFFWLEEIWWNVAVTVEGPGAAQAGPALQRLCERAQGTYYTPDTPSDEGRTPWTASGAAARGSANRNTARVLAVWCCDELAQVPGIERVALQVSPEHFSVDRPMPSD